VRYVTLDGARLVRLDAYDVPADPSATERRRTPATGAAVFGILLLGAWLLIARRKSWVDRVASLSLAAMLTAGGLTCGGGGGSNDYVHDGELIDTWPAEAVLHLSDHQGSVVALADDTGALSRETAYHPYGTVRATRGTDDDAYGYVANERDRATDLGHFGARAYRFDAAMFTSVDPLLLAVAAPEAPGPLAYGYTAGNPVLYSDPDGRKGTVSDNVKLALKIRGNIAFLKSITSDNRYSIGYSMMSRGINKLSGGILSSFSKALPITAYAGKAIAVLDSVNKNANALKQVRAAVEQAEAGLEQYETRARLLAETVESLSSPLNRAEKQTRSGVTFIGWDDPVGFDSAVGAYRSALHDLRSEAERMFLAGNEFADTLQRTQDALENAGRAHDLNFAMQLSAAEYADFMTGPADGRSPVGRIRDVQKGLRATDREIVRKLDALPPE
jgi:RHS repeat-associated protein